MGSCCVTMLARRQTRQGEATRGVQTSQGQPRGAQHVRWNRASQLKQSTQAAPRRQAARMSVTRLALGNAPSLATSSASFAHLSDAATRSAIRRCCTNPETALCAAACLHGRV